MPIFHVFEMGDSVEKLKVKRILHGRSQKVQTSPSMADSKKPIATSSIFTITTKHTYNPSQKRDRLVVSASDEYSRSAWLWDVEDGKHLYSFGPHIEPVLSMKHFSDESAEFFATLSPTQLRIFKMMWS